MICMACREPLQPIHGHYACLMSGCPMFGLNQDACCSGETCQPTASVASGRAEAVDPVVTRADGESPSA